MKTLLQHEVNVSNETDAVTTKVSFAPPITVVLYHEPSDQYLVRVEHDYREHDQFFVVIDFDATGSDYDCARIAGVTIERGECDLREATSTALNFEIQIALACVNYYEARQKGVQA